MPQPRQPPAAPQRPPTSGAAPAAAAAAAATPLIATSIAPALAAAGAAALTGAALKQAVSGLVSGFMALAEKRFNEGGDFVFEVLRDRYPQQRAATLAKLLAQERKFEKEFRRKMRERLERDVPEALGMTDPDARQARLQEIFDREKRFTVAREEAMFMRALGKAEALVLKEDSPQGAYWKLSPFVQQHTLDCLAMGEKFWPWEVLEGFQPPVHNGCACHLIGLDEAVSGGLMTEDQVPDTADAIARAKQALKDAMDMEENLEEAEVRAHIEGSAIEEARNVEPLRYAKGFTKGGEFRPRRGGSSGPRSLRALFPSPKSPLAMRGEKRGRWSWVNGVYTRIPEADAWERTVAGHHYVSPAGSTNVYRDGKLFDGLGLTSPERKPRLAIPAAPPERVEKAAGEHRDRMRSSALEKISLAGVHPPVKDGDGPSSLLALADAGYRVVSSPGAGPQLRFRNPLTKSEVDLRWDGHKIRNVTWDPAPAPPPRGATLTGPPQSWEEMRQDAFAWGRELADRYRATAQLPDIIVDPGLNDHAGTHQWSGEAMLGSETSKDIDRAAAARAEGRPLTDDELRGVWSSYWVTAHELSHSLNSIDPFLFSGPHANLEEALSEEMAHVLAVERLTEQGQGDVLRWRRNHPEAISVAGVYRQERAQLGWLLDEAGLTDPARRRGFLEELKFQTPPEERMDKLADALAANGMEGTHDELRDHVESMMEDLAEPGQALPSIDESPGKEAAGQEYGQFKDATLSGDGKTMTLPDGSERRVEKLPVLIPEVEGITDGSAIVTYKKGQPHTNSLTNLDGTPKAFRYVDDQERGKLILRAWAGKGSPGAQPQSPGDWGDDWNPLEWFKKATHSGQGSFDDQEDLDRAFKQVEGSKKGYSGKGYKKYTPPPDPMVGRKVGGLEGGDITGPIPSYDATELTLGQQAGGSNGARWAFDSDKGRWLIKQYRGDRDRVATELLANAVYRELGARVPVAGTLTMPVGKPDFRKVPDQPIDEPPLPKASKGHRVSAGMMLADDDGTIWLIEPKGHFGGYNHTVPKGGVEPGMTGQQTATKELWEETGLHGHITGFLGDYEGDTGVTRMYLARRTGGEPLPDDPTPHVKGSGKESMAVRRVSVEEAAELLNRPRDKKILADALAQGLPTQTFPDSFPEPVAPVALAYKTEDGKVQEHFAPSAKLGEHYMTDALTANWDFVGMTGDNVIWDENGDPIRLDQGGTFEMRAMGGPKPYGPVPTEVWTMLRKGQGARGVVVTEDQMRQQAADIADRLSPAKIDELVDSAPFADEEMRNRVRANLGARVSWMRDFAKGGVDLPRPAEGDKAHDELLAAQEKLELFPEQEDALYGYLEGTEQTVNEQLKGPAKDRSDATQKTIDELDSLIRHTQTGGDLIAYVPIALKGEGLGKGLEGKTVEERGYLGLDIEKPDSDAMVRVMVPEGSYGLYTGLWDDLPAQRPDLLMARGSRLKINARHEEDGKVILDATLRTEKPFRPFKPMSKPVKKTAAPDAQGEPGTGDPRKLGSWKQTGSYDWEFGEFTLHQHANADWSLRRGGAYVGKYGSFFKATDAVAKLM